MLRRCELHFYTRLASLSYGLPSQCVKINPAWSKGYARKGAALHGQRHYDEAIAAYESGLKLEDSPALRKGLKEVTDAKGMLFIPLERS